MIKYRLMRLRRSVHRTMRRLPGVPRPVASNVLTLWFIVTIVIGAVAGWKMSVGDDAAALRFLREQWQARVDNIGEIVPGAVALIGEQQSWMIAVVNSALPRRAATPTDWEKSAGTPLGADEDRASPWRRAVELLMRMALGYDVHDGQALLAAAIPQGSARDGRDSARGTEPSPGPLVSETATGGAMPPTSEGSAQFTGRTVPTDRSAQPSASPDPPFEWAAEHLHSTDRDALSGSEGTQPVVNSNGGGTFDAAMHARIAAPGPPAPEPPNGYKDEVQATFGSAGERLGDSLHNSSSPLFPEACRVLIFHTHTSETYRSDTFAPGRADQYHLWNSTDSGIVQVGRAMKQALEERFGIPTCHLTAIHDWPSHARSYIESRKTVESFLRQNPQVDLVLDVHRDAPAGLVTTVAGHSAARVAIVVGTHPTMHPASATNVAVARHIGRLLEQRYPGLFRRVIERPDARFNQDLHPRAILLEIGSYDSHLDEALRTGDLLAEVLAETVSAIRARALPGVGAPR